MTASTSNDLWVRNRLSPFYVWGKGLRQVTDWPTATQLAGVNAEIPTNPSGFKSCVVSPALPWMTYKLAGKRASVIPRDWRKILAGTNGKAKTLLPCHPDRTFGAGKTLHQAPSGTWQGDLQFFDEDISFPSSLWFLMTYGLLHAPTLLLNETLAFEVCFTMRGLSSVLP